MYVVQPHQLAHVWPQVQGWIADAIERGQGDENALDVLLAIARGHYVLWHEPEKFALVVQVQEQARQRVCMVLYLGGSDLEAIAQAVRDEGIPWCRQHGMSVIRVWGRKGWERLLGMDRLGVILQMDLTRTGALQ